MVELWERPYWLGPVYEYETWLVMRPSSGAPRWYLIDAQYLWFGKVTLLLSSDRQRLRVETNGRGTPSHLIAEYDFRRNTFRAESEPSVINTPGWTVFATAVIHE